MNTYPGGAPSAKALPSATVEDANEPSAIRCVAITFETRPDWCKKEHIDRMLEYGVTKVELGVQHVEMRSFVQPAGVHGCRHGGSQHPPPRCRVKVGFHMMPNLPGWTMESTEQMFETLFC